MNTSSLLERLADKTAYTPGSVSVRWGQLLRSNASISDDLARLAASERVAVLGSMGHLHSGVVPRANAYFIVRELPFDKIPARMHVTRADMRRIAVVIDGMDFVCRIEREFLKPILKGPDSLESVFSVRRTDLRLFDVRDSKDELTKRAATGALAYLKRGETVSYNNSSDPLKGGIPAKRSQVKNRKPYWYTVIPEEPIAAERIVLPEHHDKRYVFTKVASDDASVIIDTLYSFTPNSGDDAAFIHAGLNSLLGWYQVELRGRSQHGDGVLKVKLPDYRGILLANPQTVGAADKAAVLEAFAALKGAGTGPSLDELGTPERLAFDLAYLRACGFEDGEGKVRVLEQELRALAGERVERKLSVSDAKVSRRKATNVAASVDAYAAKVAALVQPYPDPRSFLIAGEAVTSIGILARPDGPLIVGAGLFDAGEVSDGSTVVARAGGIIGANIIKAVLTLDPDVKQIDLPVGPRLQDVYTQWQSFVTKWHAEFEKAAERGLIGVTDVRTRQAVVNSALVLLHAK
ncbi:hypothetical protein [Sinorhizobium sp. M4_45]|uniref:hypothetical protein n=1 Tax=Sinorhizobium sp. M4_45 TaxID=2037901 RepID=UPI000C99F136|nr:hypothetical protein [Sinorhizobium sp. M4_45]PND27632.1 hypothetical protein CN933_05760 [Sinorhizobium sp. M4_45]